MTYSARTGESAVGKGYDFCNDSSLAPAGSSNYFFNFNKFISTYYKDGATTNFKSVFASAADMGGLQALIDAYLLDKAYMNYNFVGNEDMSGGNQGGNQGGNHGGEDEDDVMTDAEAIAKGYVAILENGGTKTYLDVAGLEAKIAEYAHGDRITLLTNVTCKGATGSNTGTTRMDIVFDLNRKTLTLTGGSILIARNNNIVVNFTLFSANGKGTLTLAPGNDDPAIIAYRENKTIVIGSEEGYTDGDVVVINAASILYLTARAGKDDSSTTVTFWGGEYNQTASVTGKYGFTETHGRSDASGSVYFAGAVTFNGAKITQKIASERAMFNTSFMIDANATQGYPTAATAVTGIILNDCQVIGYYDNSKLHNMETLNSLITYNNCSLKGDISYVGADSTDNGLGKVIIGEGTTFASDDISFVKQYDAQAIGTYDGSTSGVYLGEGLSLSGDGSFEVIK